MTRAKGTPPGRPRTPAAVLALHGSQHLKNRANEPRFAMGSAEPPAWLELSTAAAEFWRRYAPGMIDRGLLQDVDHPAFGELAEAWALAQQCRRILDSDGVLSEGHRGPQRHPAMLGYTGAVNAFGMLASRFGFSPTDRARLAGIVPKDDEYDDLLSR